MQKSRVQADCEKLFHSAVKRSGGISTALKFSQRTLKECHYCQVFLRVFWHKLISLCRFMLAHFVHQTLRKLLSSSIPPFISCLFSKIRKLLRFNHCLSYLANQSCLQGTRLEVWTGVYSTSSHFSRFTTGN